MSRWKIEDYGKPNGHFCEICGTELVDRCLVCGAPQCCPKCCAEASEDLEMDDVRIHRSDCNGFDEKINCVGCFKAEVVEILNACHDHMIMDPSGRGCASRALKMVSRFLESQNNESTAKD